MSDTNDMTELSEEETADLMARAATKLRRALKKQLELLTPEDHRALAARRGLAKPEGEGQAGTILVDDFGGAPQTLEEAQKWIDAGIEPPMPMTSYLRIGAVPPALRVQLSMYVDAANGGVAVDPSMFAPETGEDLAVRVLGFSDDGMRRCSFEKAEAELEEASGNTPDYSQNYNAPSERETYSAELHTIGGWREHTDGNRITTTRGDKVEVIGGNYKMLVLCRDELGHSEGGQDASGGHVSGATGARGARSRKKEAIGVNPQIEHAGAEVGVAWERRSNGVWRSVETANKGDSKLVQFGDSDESSCGHYAKSKTGSDDPHPWHEPEDCTEDADKCNANPKIVDKTWAEVFETYTGSEAWPIPKLTTVSHVKDMQTEQYAKVVTDETSADTMTSSTRVNTMTDTTSAASMKTSTTVNGVMMDTTICREMDMDIVGNTMDITMANTVALTAGTSENMTIGGSASLLVGGKTDTTIGARMSVSLGATIDVMIGAKSSSTAGVEVEVSGFCAREFGAAAEAENALVHIYKGLLVKIG